MTKTGSPVKNITTTVGPGYEEIYKTEYLKFELSNTTLRRTTYGSKGETEQTTQRTGCISKDEKSVESRGGL